jgi:hypothetical protein
MLDLGRGRVQPLDLLLGEAQALHELDIPERFGRGPREGRGLGHDHLLDVLDPPAQDRAQPPEQWHRQEVGRGDHPVDAERVDHHEHDSDQGREEDVDSGGDELLDVGTHLLEFAESLAAPLVLEDRVGELEGVADPVGVDLGGRRISKKKNVVVLEVILK